MIHVQAFSVVTLVQNPQALWDLTMVQLPGSAVHKIAVQSALAVTDRVDVVGPLPARPELGANDCPMSVHPSPKAGGHGRSLAYAGLPPLSLVVNERALLAVRLEPGKHARLGAKVGTIFGELAHRARLHVHEPVNPLGGRVREFGVLAEEDAALAAASALHISGALKRRWWQQSLARDAADKYRRIVHELTPREPVPGSDNSAGTFAISLAQKPAKCRRKSLAAKRMVEVLEEHLARKAAA
jgi:hypothetical protein